MVVKLCQKEKEICTTVVIFLSDTFRRTSFKLYKKLRIKSIDDISISRKRLLPLDSVSMGVKLGR